MHLTILTSQSQTDPSLSVVLWCNCCHCGWVSLLSSVSPQSQPEMEYSLPELQAPRSNVADKPWPQVHSHTQRPHGETFTRHTHTHLLHNHTCICVLCCNVASSCRCEGAWQEGSIQNRRQREAPGPARGRPHGWARLPRLHVKVSY